LPYLACTGRKEQRKREKRDKGGGKPGEREGKKAFHSLLGVA